jgi:ABC-type oligopeptide transport system substrate-binding subunit/DNA-binding SARP family transcriptional activator
MLKVHTLGGFELWFGEDPLSPPTTIKARSLLAYLIVRRDRAWPRERLAGLFWGDRPDHRARRSLATALWHIRRCFPIEFILSDAHTAQFDPQADLWLDAEAFESHASAQDVAGLQSAIDLYQGDFLDGFYDDWIVNERYRLQTLFLEALARSMAGHEARGEHGAALTKALRLLGGDPLREDAHRLAMRAYCRLGQRNAALEQYRRCREIVRQELDAEPTVETTELYQAILEGRFAVGRVPEPLPVEVPAVEPSISSRRSPLDMMAPSPLVGREQEMVFLHRCWQGAEAGQGGLVLISGEAGVGKTRLVQEFADRLRWQGVRVLWGRCYEFERVLPYQPFAEALRSVLPLATPDELMDLPAWVLAQVARLVPEMAEQVPDLAAPSSTSPDQEQARLFDGVARLLIRLSSRGGLLIVLEDLHWASESTLQLVHYLARHLAGHHVLLVGTLRPEAIGLGHPLLALRRRLTREGLAKPLRLSRLSPAAVEAMVVEMSGAGEAAVPLAGRLYQETEGHPFFLMEIVKALFETGMVHLREGAWTGDFPRISEGVLPLPTSVSEAIQARVHSLSDAAQEALRLAAVLGREFDFDLLTAVWGRDEEATLEALDALLRHRLIDEGSGAMGRDYAFAHHKIQEVVYAGMPRRRRGHAHVRAGAAMERLYVAQAEELVGELAFHFEQGRQLDKTLTEKAIAYLLKAGDQARGLYACREAIDYYRRALAFLKEQREYERAARTLMKLGLACHSAFDFQRARRAFEEGFALWQRAGEIQPAVPPPPAPHALRLTAFISFTVDPGLASGTDATGVIEHLFSGLVELSPEMSVVPEVARSWEVSEGGRKYVFHLRDDVRWSDGNPVTAGDLEYAWKRVLDPAGESLSAHLLYDIEGARAYHQGEVSDPDRIGVRALDEMTLAVELEGPTSYFLHLLTLPTTFPVPQHVVQAHGAAWTELGNIATNGPFRLAAWERGESMLLERNPTYRGRFTGNLQQVELSLSSVGSARLLQMYEEDALETIFFGDLSQADLDRARQRHAEEYVVGPWLATFYVGFDVSRPPFDDPRVRRAFTLATERETLADVAMRGYVFPATGGFVPPGTPGHSPGIGLPYDPEGARQLLAEAGYPSGLGFPAIDCLAPSSRLAPVPIIECLQAQWLENLGIEITWKQIETGFLDRLSRGTPHMWRRWWAADYPDPDNFLRSHTWRVYTRWQNRAYDELVENARRVMDQGERMRMYQQADRILVEEAPILPLLYDRCHLLVKPWVTKFPTSPIKWNFWKEVIIEPH